MTSNSTSAMTWIVGLAVSVVIIEALLFLWFRPSLRTMLIYGVAGVIGVALSAMALLKLEAQAQFTQYLTSEGLRGTAKIVWVQSTNVMINRRPQVRLGLQVQLPGKAPYALEHLEVLPFAGYGVAPDRVVAVFVDPKNPQALMVDWTTSPVTAAPASRTQGDTSVAARLEQLEELRRRQLISAQEYEAQRQRLLSEL